MLLETDRQLLIASLTDELLNDLSSLNSFMRPKEYKKIYEYSKNWKSKEWFLKKFFYDKLDMNPEDNEINYEIKLFAMEKSSLLSDALAIIPFEFQYIKKTDGLDIILLRMYLGANNFRIATIEVSQDVYSSIQEHFQSIQGKNLKDISSNVFDLACFQCVQEYSERVFRNKGEFVDDWEVFQREFERQHNITLREYSDVGKYLWQTNYLCFDNRFKKGEKILTILEQLEKDRKQIAEENEHKKKGIAALKSLFIDEFGNYWKSEKAYLNYKRL